MSKITPDAFAHSQPVSEIENDLARQVPSVTLFTADGQSLTKRCSIENGALRKASLSTFSRGTAETRSVATASVVIRSVARARLLTPIYRF
ncbi:hypothetical protein [uncultured Limimaricola sp.]|mgnify:CR=1 FL=1|uniref:hypothetical protein n=1 Tax=uncultured Limimaricola sp. TaxID=2211667 RepID=UPI0030F562B7